MVGEEALRARQALVGDPEISPEPPDEWPAEPIRQAVVRQRAEDAAQHAARDRHPQAHLSLRREVAGGRHRSEERRVGKECRSRWSPYQEKEKKAVGLARVARRIAIAEYCNGAT